VLPGGDDVLVPEYRRHVDAAFPLAQDPDFYLFEFACHEGNDRGMRSMLGGARLADG
jgi:hypothetical protein